jgi:hypothetical protein
VGTRRALYERPITPPQHREQVSRSSVVTKDPTRALRRTRCRADGMDATSAPHLSSARTPRPHVR